MEPKSLNRFTKTATFTAKANELFHWHTRPATFKRLFPSWLDSRKYTFVLKEAKEGALLSVSKKLPKFLKIFDLFSYTLKYTSIKENSSFTTLMIKGPYAYFSHEQSYHPAGKETKVKDQVLYKAPLGKLGQKLLAPSIRQNIRRTLNYRQTLAKSDLNALKPYSKNQLLRIIISGASGFVGDTLASFLKSAGHEVLCLVRDKKRVDDTHIYWNPEKGEIALSLLNNCDALINLAGENIDQSWSAPKRALLRKSRVEATHFLLESLDQLDNPPPTLISASACGYYGYEEEREMTEKDPPGRGFLAKLCVDWEEAAMAYASRDLRRRTLLLRFGMILGARGGALPKMATAARFGLLPCLGSGQQKISWISIDDAVYAIHHLLRRPEIIAGPVNICTPEPVTNEELTRLILKIYGKKFTFKTPERLLELAMGRKARELLLSKSWMAPTVLQESKFHWEYRSLEETLRQQLGLYHE